MDDADRGTVDGSVASTLTTSVPLSSIKAVANYLPYIDSARQRVTTDMEQMVINGLRTLVRRDLDFTLHSIHTTRCHVQTQNQSLLASSLQTAHNLRVLPDLVQNLVSDLSDAVEGRIRFAFDLSRIAKEVVAKGNSNTECFFRSVSHRTLLITDPSAGTQGNLMYKSRLRTEPTNVTAPQWTAALWSSLESMIEEMADCCIKVDPTRSIRCAAAYVRGNRFTR